MIEVKNVYMIYSELVDTVALTDITLTINKGEFVAIAGSNASGKSTLLKCMAGFEEPNSGHIVVDGMVLRDMTLEEKKEFRSKKIGFIFQDFGVLDFMTVEENLWLPLEIAGFSPEASKKKFEQIVTEFDLKPLLKRKCTELSGGQLQRVAIAVGVINEPEIIFADEPTSQLDKVWRKKTIEFFKKLNKQGKTIVMVSHDQYDLEQVQRIIILDKGYLEQVVEVKGQ